MVSRIEEQDGLSVHGYFLVSSVSFTEYYQISSSSVVGTFSSFLTIFLLQKVSLFLVLKSTLKHFISVSLPPTPNKGKISYDQCLPLKNIRKLIDIHMKVLYDLFFNMIM